MRDESISSEPELEIYVVENLSYITNIAHHGHMESTVHNEQEAKNVPALCARKHHFAWRNL